MKNQWRSLIEVMSKMDLGSLHGLKLSQNPIVILCYGNNNHQSTCLLTILSSGSTEVVTLLMTLEVSTKTEKLPLINKEKMMLVSVLLITTILTKLV